LTEDTREVGLAPIPLPTCMNALIAGYEWARDTVGKSGGTAYRLHRPGSPTLHLKYGQGTLASDITEEMVRLRWLVGRVPAPEVRHFVASAGKAWLLMAALPGKSARQLLEGKGTDQGAVVDAMAGFLRRFHSLRVEECPFNSGSRHRLFLARKRLDAGLVSVQGFDEERAGSTAEQVWDEMISLVPKASESVITHGDLSLDNVLIEDNHVVGIIDVARMGSADRYQDLAILWNCLGDFEAALQERLFVSYGIASPDMRSLRFHVLLDEFF